MKGRRNRAAVLAAAALAGLVAVGASVASAGTIQTPPTTGSSGAAARTPSAKADGPTLRITQQSTYVAENGTFEARLVLRDAPAGSYLSTTLHRRVRDRAAFTASVETGDEADLTDRIATFDTEPDGDLGIAVTDIPERNDARVLESVIPLRAPDGSTPATPSPKPVGRVDVQTLDEPGVYPVQYRLLRPDGSVLARAVTHIIRLPGRADRPTGGDRLRVATVLPMNGVPVLQPDGKPAVDESVRDRITTVLDAVSDQSETAFTLDLDPQAVLTLATADEETGTDDLSRLVDVASDSRHQVLTSTYAGVDTRAFADAGLADELTAQRIKAIEAITEQVAEPDVGTWAARPDLSPATVTELRALGVNQLVVPEPILSPLDDRWSGGLYQPFKVVNDKGVPMPAVQADRGLQAAFTRNPDMVLNAHQLVAEVAVIAESAGDGDRGVGGVVVMPPDGWSPSPTLLGIVLDAVGEGAPLTTAVTVDQVFDTIPPAAANGPSAADRGGDLTRVLNPVRGSDLGSYPVRLTDQRNRLASLESMVGAASPPTAQARELLDVSGARTLDAAGRGAYLASAADHLSKQFARISAPASEQVTLTARDAEIPMTVRSDLGAIAQVVIELEGSNRLSFPQGSEVDATLDPGRNRIGVSVRAPTSGDSPLRMRVLSPDRRVVLAETRYTVRSTAVSGVGLILTIGAFGFLVIWWARHWRSSRRRGRHASAGRHPASAPPPEPGHDPEAATDPAGVPAVSTEGDA